MSRERAAQEKNTSSEPTGTAAPAHRAPLIAIEGIDGSGKGTQAQRLVKRLQEAGLNSELLSFPRYDKTFFGGAVGSFLNGKFGSLDQVHPFLVSLLFAGDRFESRPLLNAALARCDVVVLDRYVASNIAHQAAKLTGAEREALCRSIEHVEYDLFEMPRPDRVLLLDLSVPVAQTLVAKKGARNYTERAADIQEADANYLGRVREMYRELAAREPNWSVIGCEGTEGLRTLDEIADEIWRIVKPLVDGKRPAS
jgi:dTMP kinase